MIVGMVLMIVVGSLLVYMFAPSLRDTWKGVKVCETCDGDGAVLNLETAEDFPEYDECPDCDGEGTVPR